MIFLNRDIRMFKGLLARVALLLVLMSAAGCKQKFPSVPDDIISIKKMETILIDMHISDAVAEVKTMGDINEKRISQQYYAQIFHNYGITKEDFLKSYLFYENNPVLLNKMYDDILGEMSKSEAKINK